MDSVVKLKILEKAKNLKENAENIERLYTIRAELSNSIINILENYFANNDIKNKDSISTSYNQSETQLYIYFETEYGEMNITIDLIGVKLDG